MGGSAHQASARCRVWVGSLRSKPYRCSRSAKPRSRSKRPVAPSASTTVAAQTRLAIVGPLWWSRVRGEGFGEPRERAPEERDGPMPGVLLPDRQREGDERVGVHVGVCEAGDGLERPAAPEEDVEVIRSTGASPMSRRNGRYASCRVTVTSPAPSKMCSRSAAAARSDASRSVSAVSNAERTRSSSAARSAAARWTTSGRRALLPVDVRADLVESLRWGEFVAGVERREVAQELAGDGGGAEDDVGEPVGGAGGGGRLSEVVARVRAATCQAADW